MATRIEIHGAANGRLSSRTLFQIIRARVVSPKHHCFWHASFVVPAAGSRVTDSTSEVYPAVQDQLSPGTTMVSPAR
ncbi:hypothetical protein CVO76_12085 [Arthrobacter agilis]|uniref:Uncharacterized protein n=1 Tax=Arthrobacter agilis TaxID=37921 RepID=A0A2L0UGB0_9MICC|nr:hypothetical protein CVO76_12085 [Arthrobacter agilis]